MAIPAEYSWTQFIPTHKIGYPEAQDHSYPAAYHNLDAMQFAIDGVVVPKPSNYCIIVPDNSNDVLDIYKTDGNWLYPRICTAGTAYVVSGEGGRVSYTLDGVSVTDFGGYGAFYSMYYIPDLDGAPAWNFFNPTQQFFPPLTYEFISMGACLFYIDQHFRGIKLNVDGVDWTDYNWVSVPSVTGKNGVLYALSTLTDINSGSPITTSDTTKFSLSPTTNVGRLVSDRMNSGT